MAGTRLSDTSGGTTPGPGLGFGFGFDGESDPKDRTSAGADASQSWRGYLESWILAERDIVFAGQRGTGGDNRLTCPQAVDDGNVQGYLDPLFREEVFRPCLAELGRQFDLTKYSTPLAADDYDELRRAAAPKLDEEFRAILARLEAKPAATSVTHPVTREKAGVRLSREGFLEALRVMMYSGARNRLVPFLIHRAFEGDFEPFAELGLTSERNLRMSLALGHLLSVTCGEDVARIRDHEIVKVAGGTLAGDGRVREQQRMCAKAMKPTPFRFTAER